MHVRADSHWSIETRDDGREIEEESGGRAEMTVKYVKVIIEPLLRGCKLVTCMGGYWIDGGNFSPAVGIIAAREPTFKRPMQLDPIPHTTNYTNTSAGRVPFRECIFVQAVTGSDDQSILLTVGPILKDFATSHLQ